MNEIPLILFDGYCNLCNGVVNIIIRYDRKQQFRFVELQSVAGQLLSGKFQIPKKSDSVILIKNNRFYTESDAGLQILKMLGFPWNLFFVFVIIPKKIRDKIYRWVARNRYKWFGKRMVCRVPNEKEKFLFPDLSELLFKISLFVFFI